MADIESADESHTINGFCRLEKISRAYFYKLKAQGRGRSYRMKMRRAGRARREGFGTEQSPPDSRPLAQFQAFDLEVIDRLTAGRLGVFDIACPACGPDRRSAVNRRRKVLRIWRDDPGFASYHCARCGLSGFARDGDAQTGIDPQRIAKLRAEAKARDEHHARRQHQKALALRCRRAAPSSRNICGRAASRSNRRPRSAIYYRSRSAGTRR